MIHVVATIEVAQGRVPDFLEILNANVPAVRAEDGCIEYAPAIDAKTDIAAQKPLGDNVVVVLEKWESSEALVAHLAAPHMATFREKVRDIVINTTLNVLQPA